MMLCLIKMKMKPICIYHYLWLNPFCSHKFQYNCYLMCVRVWECVCVDKVVKNFSTTIYTKLHHCIPFTFVMFASRTTALRTSTSMIKYRMRFVKGFYHNTQYSCLFLFPFPFLSLNQKLSIFLTTISILQIYI